MAKMIELKDVRKCQHNMGECRHDLNYAAPCSVKIGISPYCPLPDAPDPERYREAIELLGRAIDFLSVGGCAGLCNDITAFLAGEDGR